ncbi:hypothetical protein OENI_1280003 [Oenococcus oeni]|nr:hypothetical protein OENI_1280003 [Oenococcus oeni]
MITDRFCMFDLVGSKFNLKHLPYMTVCLKLNIISGYFDYHSLNKKMRFIILFISLLTTLNNLSRKLVT